MKPSLEDYGRTMRLHRTGDNGDDPFFRVGGMQSPDDNADFSRRGKRRRETDRTRKANLKVHR